MVLLEVRLRTRYIRYRVLIKILEEFEVEHGHAKESSGFSF